MMRFLSLAPNRSARCTLPWQSGLLAAVRQSRFFALVLAIMMPTIAVPAPGDQVIRGKNDWLFVRFEAPLEEAVRDAATSLGLISKLSSVLARNQIALAVVVVPSKMETHVEHLPDDYRVSPYMSGFNANVQARLKAGGVQVIDLKGPLRQAALNAPDSPVFYRLDSHWTPTGALAAASTMRAAIEASPSLKRPFDQVLAEKYLLSWSGAAVPARPPDILRLLPAGSFNYAPEAVRNFSVSRAAVRNSGLLAETTDGDIALVGSSFSDEATGFPGALRYVLQRDMLNFSIKGDLGPWMMMKSYLANDACQSRRPRLVIWEIPERAISWPPSYPHREARHIMGDQDWLRQVSALVLQHCDPAPITPSLIPTGMLAGPVARAGTSTTENDFIELGFEPPADEGTYLSARVTTAGSRTITLEASSAATPTRRFSLDVSGDDLDQALKAPLGMGSHGSRGINRLKIYPGKTTAFALADIEVCRYPDYLLSP
jgi:alginate O-acetyltransferase complex protein AlgJ